MLVPMIILGVIAVALLATGYFRGQGEHILGLKSGLDILIQMLPMVVLAFVVAGMIQVLVPTDMISHWLGAESGMRGIFIGTAVGSIMPGGPMTSLPIAAGLLRIGAGVGTMVAFTTGWSLIAIFRLPLEVGLMGWKFTLIRLACTFFFAPLAGWLANRLFSGVTLFK